MAAAAQVIAFPRARIALAELVSMSETLLAAAEAGDWTRACALQPERRACLEAFFADPEAGLARDTIADAIRHILALDARVADLALQRRQDILAEAGALRQGHAARRAYAGSAANHGPAGSAP